MRSTLFVPGDSEKKFIKAMSATGMSRPDGLILDLEDSVAASEKPKARQMTASFIAAARAKADAPRQYVRINPVETNLWREDLAAIMGAAPDGIFQPKCRSGADVMTLANALDEAERKHGLPVGSTRIMAIITEVPISLLNLSSYVGCSARVEALTWGAEELSASPDFFAPLHASHLADHAPALIPYMGLAPGFRVLLAPGQEDVWFDPKL